MKKLLSIVLAVLMCMTAMTTAISVSAKKQILWKLLQQ